ncbi:hypothetical protein [Phormidium yuhuli]|uniref:hypothetical protein n=1 Tax=Phormidium yuhuli TaxID=2974039 RepID=UPI00403E5A50
MMILIWGRWAIAEGKDGNDSDNPGQLGDMTLKTLNDGNFDFSGGDFSGGAAVGIIINGTLRVLQPLIRCRWQFAVAVWEKYHALYETEQLFLARLHDETACVNPFDELLQNRDLREDVQSLAA